MTKYVKRPVMVDAIQWNGSNLMEIQIFIGKKLSAAIPPHGMEFNHNIPNEAYSLIIPTLEGDMTAIKGDYIIKGVQGEFYPCKPDIFEATYDAFVGSDSVVAYRDV